MIAGVSSWLSRRKWILAVIAVPVLVAAWSEFRPERLWINKQVSEPAPLPRAAIYQVGDSKRDLRLTDFTTSNGPDVHVLLAQGADQNLTKEFVKGELDSVEPGSPKANQGDQNYDLPDSADLEKYNSVVVYCERFHVVFGLAK